MDTMTNVLKAMEMRCAVWRTSHSIHLGFVMPAMLPMWAVWNKTGLEDSLRTNFSCNSINQLTHSSRTNWLVHRLVPVGILLTETRMSVPKRPPWFDVSLPSYFALDVSVFWQMVLSVNLQSAERKGNPTWDFWRAETKPEAPQPFLSLATKLVD